MTDDDKSMLTELLKHDGGCLTDWDIWFLDSLNSMRDRTLSTKQSNILDRMWDKVFN